EKWCPDDYDAIRMVPFATVIKDREAYETATFSAELPVKKIGAWPRQRGPTRADGRGAPAGGASGRGGGAGAVDGPHHALGDRGRAEAEADRAVRRRAGGRRPGSGTRARDPRAQRGRRQRAGGGGAGHLPDAGPGAEAAAAPALLRAARG